MPEHELEPELRQPPPRPVQRRGGLAVGCGLWMLRLFILPHTIVGVVMLVLAVAQTLLWAAIALFGTELQARVEKTTSHRAKSSMTYRLHYSYTIDGVEHTYEVDINQAEHAALKKGQPLTVRHYPGVPHYGHWPQVESHSPLVQVFFFWGFALFWNGVLSIFLWMAWIVPWQQWRIVRYGEATTGIIREVTKTHGKSGMSYKFRYEFACLPSDSAEGVVSGTVSSSQAAAASLNVGDLVTVLYDPRRPKRNLLYAVADFEVKPAPMADAP